MKPKLLRITTVPLSLHKLLYGQATFMQKNGFKVVLASSNGKEIKEIEKETSLKVKHLPFTRKIAPFRDLIALWHAYKLIKKEKPDIVHTHTPKAGLLGMLAAKLARVPIRMHTVAGLPLMQATGVQRKILNFTERLTSKSATHVYPNSFAMASFMITEVLAPKEKIKVLAKGSSNGIDTAYFSPKNISIKTQQKLRTSLQLHHEDLVFTFVGRLVGDKGINELVSAFEQLHQQTPLLPVLSVAEVRGKSLPEAGRGVLKLLLVGNQEASLDPLLPTTIKNIEENPNILATGWVDDIRPYLTISDVFVFPSYREGMPNVVLQAGAMGLPQIVTDINGSNEIIFHNENGIIINVKDARALYNAMQQMLSPALREDLSKNARELISSRFEQKIVWEALLAEYLKHTSSAAPEHIKICENDYLCKNKVSMYARYIKPLIDFTAALFTLLILSPIIALISILLFLNNKGKIFFIQTRPGKDEKLFKIIKFKTMNDKRDAAGNLVSDAQRLTRIGKLIRKTSLDEFPQLINVLKGDMSLIGPRPLLPEYLPLYTEEQKKRHQVKPGITGWAQVNGRNAISWEQKFDFDLWYVENLSFWIDLKIVFLTIQKVLTSKDIAADGNATIGRFKGSKTC